MRNFYTLFLTMTLLMSVSSFAQKNVDFIYTDFDSFWKSGVGAINNIHPNRAHNLLAFKLTGGTTIFSTGVNDAQLTANNVTFTSTKYQALPVQYLGTATGSTYIGLGRNYFPPYTLITGGALTNGMAYYLADGLQGLDLGTAVFNIPKSNIEYRVSDFNIATISDNIPDVIATQMGDYSSGVEPDVFKFVDANGVTVGNEIKVNFSNVTSVGIQEWAFFNGSNGVYSASQPGGGGTPYNRDTRLLSWELKDFGLTISNVGRIDRFIHTLSGVSDPAFMAYNTSSFAAVADLTACDNSVTPSLWLQAHFAARLTTNTTNVQAWENRAGGNITKFEQADINKQPAFNSGSDNTGFNYNPHLEFKNKWMGFSGGPLKIDDSFDVFIVAKKNAAGTGGNIYSISTNNLGENKPAFFLDANGHMQLTNDNQVLSATGVGEINTSLWRLSYKRGGNVDFFKNGISFASFQGPYNFDFGMWYSHLGSAIGTNNFDLAELIVFPGNNTVQERQKIESSLAIKYGFSLTDNYISGNKTIIWNRTGHTFNSRIFGIGSESCFALLQKQSQSESDPDKMLRVGRDIIEGTNAANTATLANGEYLLYGDNNGSLSNLKKTNIKSKCLLSPERTWRNQRTGNVINTQSTQVKLRYDNITWGQTVSAKASDFFLMIDVNANGNYNDPEDMAIVASSLENGYAVFNVVWDADGSGTDLFTIGMTSAVPCNFITNPMIYQRIIKK